MAPARFSGGVVIGPRRKAVTGGEITSPHPFARRKSDASHPGVQILAIVSRHDLRPNRLSVERP